MNTQHVKLYTLTTCGYCKSIKKMLDDFDVQYDCCIVDVLEGVERDNAIEELKKVNPRCSFPTVVIDKKAITGLKIQEIKETLGIRTELDDLYDNLKRLQESKGYFFNKDKEKVFDLLRGLLTNKDRYGYMSCPCRLALGNRESDKDIFCPCPYREPDVKEYGSCFCGLYVSNEWNDGSITRRIVPERRSAGHY